MRQVRDEFQIPILLVTHDLDECIELADEMLSCARAAWCKADRREHRRAPGERRSRAIPRQFNLIEAEILELDPRRNLSRLRARDSDLTGPYFPGRSAATTSGCASARTRSPRVPATDGRPEPDSRAASALGRNARFRPARIFGRNQSRIDSCRVRKTQR